MMNELRVLRSDVTELKEMRTEVSELKGMRSELGVLRQDVNVIKGDVSELKQGQNKLVSEVSELKYGQRRLEEGLVSLHKNIMDSLDTFTESIAAHFEEKTEVLNKRVYKVETEIESLRRR